MRRSAYGSPCMNPSKLRGSVGRMGAAWSFNLDDRTLWDWKELVAQLNHADMEKLVGPGLVRCSIAVRPGSYDHARHKAIREEMSHLEHLYKDFVLPMWDIVMHRCDGTGLRLHPSRKDNTFPTFDIEGQDWPVEPPQEGCGNEMIPVLRRRHEHRPRRIRSRYHCASRRG